MKGPGRPATRPRRSFLRLAAVAIGATFLVVSGGLFDSSSIKRSIEDLTGSMVGPNDSENSRASLITVRVYYSMMAQYIALDEENFVLQSPATLQTLINTCLLRHPSVAQMVGTMFILLDGAPSRPSATLRDGDTVQFIPMVAGG
jgi:molybdopterin converting factor small subunit